jgi:60 kDa SS-A/Ro ribonucleoprotein
MSNVNKMFTPSDFAPKADIKNRDGYAAFSKPLQEQYLQLILTNQLGSTFYADRKEMLAESIELHKEIFAKDPVFMAKAIRYARNKGFMKSQPTLGLSILAGNPDLFSKVFADVVLIPDDLSDFMTMIKSQGRGEGGRAIHRAVGNFFRNKMNEYWALKYASASRSHGYDLGDLIITHHIAAKKDDPAQQALFRYLVLRSAISQGTDQRKRDTAKKQMAEFITEKLHLLPQVEAYEKLKNASTEKEQIELIKLGRLPMEVITAEVTMTPALWEAVMEQMPVFALLRNIETLRRAGVLDKNREYISKRLTDAVALEKAKIMPYNLLKAFDKIESGWVKDSLRIATEYSLNNIPDIDGVTGTFFDVSSSMWNKEMYFTGAIFAYAIHKKTRGDGVAWAFNEAVYDMEPSVIDSILSQAARITGDGAKSRYRNTDGTDTGAVVRRLAQMNKKVDNIVMITDEQQNTGRPFYGELLKYKANINKDVKAFIIDISPYREAMTPKEKNVFYIYGWSDKVLNFISMASEGFGSMTEVIDKGEL